MSFPVSPFFPLSLFLSALLKSHSQPFKQSNESQGVNVISLLEFIRMSKNNRL